MTNANVATAKPFRETDFINCTVMRCGRHIVSFSISGMKSVADLFRYIATLIPDVKGLLTLSFRNMSQGWTDRRSFVVTG